MSTCETSGYRRLPDQAGSSQNKIDTSVNLADLMTKPIPKTRIEQLMNLMGYEFVGAETSALKGQARHGGIDVQ